MAEVYQCRLEGIGGFDKLVVVKTIHSKHLDDPSFVKMFLEEARVAANLTHPNVVQIFEVDEVNGAPYLAMEYVRGPTLAQLLEVAKQKRRLSWAYGAKIISGLCAGLAYVHSATNSKGEKLNMVHRDVSPQNVLVSLDGVPKLLDFGIAKARGEREESAKNSLKGKLRYMAPELFRPEPASPRTDVFAAGACLFEATTGEPLYPQKSEAELLKACTEGRHRKPSEVFVGCPERLEQIILWATHADPKQRCPTALDLHEALETLVGQGASAVSAHDVADWVSDLFPREASPLSVGGVALLPPTPPGLVAVESTAVRLNTLSTEAETKVTIGSGSIDETRVKPQTPSPPVVDGARVATAMVSVQSHARPEVAAPPTPIWATSLLSGAIGGCVGALVLYVAGPQASEAIRKPTPPPVAPPTNDATSYLESVDTLVKAGRYDLAREVLNKARVLPNLNQASTMKLLELESVVEREGGVAKARTLLQLGDVEGARAVIRTAAEHDIDPATLASLLHEVDARSRGLSTSAPASAPTPAPTATSTPSNSNGDPKLSAHLQE
jgi:serine/threonine-protein kinase